MLRIDQLVDLLGLGAPTGTATHLKPDDVNPVFAMDTDRGPWVIKTARPAGPWWFEQAQRAASLEKAALDAGISMPAPAPEVRGEHVGMWSAAGDGTYARALVRISGSHPPPHALAPEVASWVGATLAGIDAVAPPVAGPWEETGYRTHPAAEWADWLDEARALGVLSPAQAADTAVLVAELGERIQASIVDCPALKVLHRDVSRFNILLSEGGPQLLDFDSAGPQVPWWEAVGHFFALASADLGRVEPDRRSVEAAVTGYCDAGGKVGAAGAEAFTGKLAAQLSASAFFLWNACGHRGGDVAWHQRCAENLRTSLGALGAIAASAQRWSTWLR